jgi:hypothetical protein
MAPGPANPSDNSLNRERITHAHSPLVGRHSDSPDHPDLVAALNVQLKKIPAAKGGGLTARRTGDGPPMQSFLSLRKPSGGRHG